ncbi:hypothetical protein [Hymenobacter arcticus]
MAATLVQLGLLTHLCVRPAAGPRQFWAAWRSRVAAIPPRQVTVVN